VRKCFFQNTVAALRVHIVLEITGKRRNDLHPVRREIFRQPAMESVSMMVRLLRSMTWQPQPRAVSTKVAEVFAQLRRAAGEVNHRGPMPANPLPIRSATGADIISVRHGAAST